MIKTDFIDRLISERKELQEKYFKLKDYLYKNMKNIDNGNINNDSNDFDLLQKQYEIMGDYLIILNIRIRRAVEKYGMSTNLALTEDNETDNWDTHTTWDSLWIDLIDKSIKNGINYITCKNFKIYKIINRNSLYEINDTEVVPFYVEDKKNNIYETLKLIKNKDIEGQKLKAKYNDIEIPWGVTTLDVLIQDTNFKDKYLQHEDTDEELIETFTNGFNYVKGQIVEISLTGFGRIPAIVTNINDRDINGHLTYDIVILLGERNKSAIKSKERYLWRFTEKADENTINNFNKLIEILYNPVYGYDEYFIKDSEIDSICYLTGTTLISYNLNQINPNKVSPLSDPATEVQFTNTVDDNAVLKEADDNEHF